MRVLVLGADGFIGRHIACHLRAQGHEVIASARDPRRLAAMGFASLRADLTAAETHDPAFWKPHLTDGTHLVNAAGLLTGSSQAFEAVHVLAPRAAMAALGPKGHALLISAVGLESDTTFARWRRQGEAAALAANCTILRPGLVLADTSYGGSSLLRALAALPFATPVIGCGDQRFNPIHAADLAVVVAACLTTPPGPGPWEIGGPEMLSQRELITLIRRWLGRPPQPILCLPLPLAMAIGRLGDALRLGPISATAVAQLQAGVLATPAPVLAGIAPHPRPVSGFVMARPAGTQDLWQARLYLLKPLTRLTLAVMWLASAGLGLALPPADFLPALATAPLPETALVALARLGGMADLALGLALLRDWQPRKVALAQLLLVAGYTAGLTLFAPTLWLDPFGGLLKNLPVLVLILIHLALSEER